MAIFVSLILNIQLGMLYVKGIKDLLIDFIKGLPPTETKNILLQVDIRVVPKCEPMV